MAKRLLWIGVVLCGGALVFIGLLNFLGWAMLYHPHPYRSNYPKLLSRGVSPLAFRTSAGRQTAVYFRPNDGAGLPDRIWVVFGGNGSLALDWLPLAARAQAPGMPFSLSIIPVTEEARDGPPLRTRAPQPKGPWTRQQDGSGLNRERWSHVWM